MARPINNEKMDEEKRGDTRRHWGKSVASFLMVLLTMPLGHALMILMEKILSESALHYAGFAMGAVGLGIVIAGVFAKGDTRQTLCGLFGGLLYWTGWYEFLFQYYANRYGVMAEVVDGEVVTKPEYLIMPATFGLWVMVMTLYVFSTRTGCCFINWVQRRLRLDGAEKKKAQPVIRHSSIVTFMELIVMMWTCYIALMFCYDDNFLGERHPVTLGLGMVCMASSVLMFRKQLRIGAWGANIRMAIAVVVVFWTPVEILGRMDFFKEFWVEPQEYAVEMICILAVFAALAVYLCVFAGKKRKA